MRQRGHTSRLPAEKRTSREIVPEQRPGTLLSRCQKHTKATGNDVRDWSCPEKKGKIRPVGTIPRDVMRQKQGRQEVYLTSIRISSNWFSPTLFNRGKLTVRGME